jgi:hypothetical protein
MASGFFDHDAVGVRPGINLARMFDVGKPVTKRRMRLIFLANCIGVSSLLATVLGSTTRHSRIVGYTEVIAKCGQRGSML